jgi:uncharacterized protein
VNKTLGIVLSLVLIAVLGVYFYLNYFEESKDEQNPGARSEDFGEMPRNPHPLSIESLRVGSYPGSELTVEQELPNGSNYSRRIVSYRSEGLKIYALLTVPLADPPEGGYPAIIFNHGYIPPAEYRTTERYIAYTDIFSRNGYILLRPDYRGHGNSEGMATGGYGSNNYTIDVLNALSSLKKYRGVDPDKIGMWGHSMGGFITLRNMVVSNDIKTGVIWAGVVASYEDLLNNWRRRSPNPAASPNASRGWRQAFVGEYGEPSSNPEFWNSISANTFLTDISGPVQMHHGTADTSVPVEFSQTLDNQLKAAGKESELYIYEGDDHNLSGNLSIALNRSIEFFDKYLKD